MDVLTTSQVLLIALAAFIVFITLKAVKAVPQGMEYTVERFGRYTRTLKPGLTFIVPFVDRIGYQMNMRERVIDIPSQDVITKDNAMVTADAVVFIQVIDARQAAYEVNNLDNAIKNLCLTNVRTVVGSMDLDEVLSRRDEINAKLLEAEAKATEMVSVAIAKGDVNAVNYFVAQDYVKAFGELAKSPNQKTVIVPAELSSLAATVGGLGALMEAGNIKAKK